MVHNEPIGEEQNLPVESETNKPEAPHPLNDAAHPDEVTRADGSPAKERKRRKTALVFIAACLLLLVTICASVIGVFQHYYSLLATDDWDADYSHVVSLTDGELEEIPEGSVELPEEDVYSQEDVINILLIGTDERTAKFDKYARADSIMLLSLNKKTNAVKLTSLERGMLVKIPGRHNDILTHTFHFGGTKLVMQTVRTHFNVDVDRYVRVNFAVFQKLVDDVGGVDVKLTKAEADRLRIDLGNEKLKEGPNHLNGREALGYSRLRSIDSDWNRIKRQRKVILSIKNNLKSKSIGELNTLANECLPYVQTNLTSMEFADLLIHMPDYVDGEFEQMTIPRKGTYQTLGNVDFKANSKILRDFIYNR